MIRVFLVFTVLLLMTSCKTHIYTVKLDPQLYTMPISYGQKLVGLVYYKKSSYVFSFDSEKLLKNDLQKKVNLVGGNKVLPLVLINMSNSISDQVKSRSKELYVKGYIVNDLSE